MTLKKVRKVLEGLDQHKSVNGVTPRFLKQGAKWLARPLTSLYRRLAREARFPAEWKHSRVTPLHKKGSVKSTKNYRPVSVLPNLAVAFERVLDAQFDAFVLPHIPESQFGFLKGCGGNDYGALLSMTLADHLERGDEVLVVSLDVKGAFDKVWWKGLLVHLRSIGVRGRAYRLLENYLCDRSLAVVARGDISGSRSIGSGVPQGAVWSPKLCTWVLVLRTWISLTRYNGWRRGYVGVSLNPCGGGGNQQLSAWHASFWTVVAEALYGTSNLICAHQGGKKLDWLG